MFTPGALLGTYRLIDRIGVGGMGEVWKAEDTRLGRMVAIKILPPSIAADPEAIARMRREARTAAQLNHPNIATIYAFEESDEHRFIAMELVEGEPLTKRIERAALPEADVCRIGGAIADAVAEAHARGVIHRDIKPDNIMVGGSRVKVLDFGIAKQVEVIPGAQDPTAPLTQQGMIIGTIHYMSPEQALGKKLGRPTDIFSLGVVLYQAATGRLPFRGESVTETLTQIIRDDPPPTTGVSDGLARIIERCLRKNPDERFAAGELASQLDAHRGGAPTVVVTGPNAQTVKEPVLRRRRRGLWAAPFALLAVVLAVLVAMGVFKKEEPVVVAKPVQVAVTPSTATVEVVTATVPPTVTTTDTAASAAGEGARRHTDAEPRGPTATLPVAKEPPPAAAEKPRSEKPEMTASKRLVRGEEHLLAREFDRARADIQKALENPEDLLPKERAIAQLGLAIANGNRRRAIAIFEVLRRDFPGDQRILRLLPLIEEQRPPQPRPPRGRPRPGRRP
ncbi:MAG: serine/threonine protein kinase [Thermoanaerobaculia bacterium]|nr:serine/threonine protein kinase [Thermoanaerobaculia bacterium]